MSSKLVVATLAFAGVFILSASQDPCELSNGEKGTCKPLSTCPDAIEQLKKQKIPKRCSFQDLQPVVCCKETPKPQTTKRIRKSEQKCLEYRLNLNEGTDQEPLITGGEDAVPKEFPHMAVLGYGKEDDIQWKCGGSLVSDQFVVTAAHCLHSTDYGDVKYVRLGDLDLYSTRDDADPQQFKIIQTIPYQEYDSEASYHDIALLKLETTVKFTEYVRPACLQNEYKFNNITLKATGWGALYFGTDHHSFLQKVNLHKFAKKDCDKTYKPGINLRVGIMDSVQICAGSFVGGLDTCQGDSGGPLQMVIQTQPLMYRIVGIVSTGKYCGLVPGLYTRVSAYITWIEEHVWSN